MWTRSTCMHDDDDVDDDDDDDDRMIAGRGGSPTRS
jgi:hypothetical protein